MNLQLSQKKKKNPNLNEQGQLFSKAPWLPLAEDQSLKEVQGLYEVAISKWRMDATNRLVVRCPVPRLPSDLSSPEGL